jgi:hypothetical protein
VVLVPAGATVDSAVQAAKAHDNDMSTTAMPAEPIPAPSHDTPAENQAVVAPAASPPAIQAQ